MSEYALFIVALLFILAISDLIVGVSNDAVNFLNSAIGSKVATARTIMIVASLGIILGATFSSGMMEVARKGIFNPEMLSFDNVVIIFLAVMLTDIILLDVFSTLGLPTSTTVSIVFELLGATVAVALILILTNGSGSIVDYVNYRQATLIVGGIFISIVIAFNVGLIAQYISRLLFTFNYMKRLKSVGWVWSGFAFSCITYFLFIKGLKGASFVNDEIVATVKENLFVLFSISLVFWSLASWIIIEYLKVNILKWIVLVGTFALAFAFAGNDLVNFIGVPIAGFESFKFFQEAGADGSMKMVLLAEPVRTPTAFLVVAGLIMVVTLWISDKAKSVTKTTVDLSRQMEGEERFRPNRLSKGIVNGSVRAGLILQSLLPKKLLTKWNKSFDQSEIDRRPDAPSFDLIRASVNLTIASILISIATSIKLPLSTTYVSFMVAMGTSLADGAWGIQSAAYRVAGVLNVIAGWLLTALIAFTVSAVFALIFWKFKLIGVLAIVALVVFLVIKSFYYHRKNISSTRKEN